ncbi:MAG TPA: MoxR family ATPase [Phycisphaerales bacterium]|nr:MoxR family ATPase [Phycisphaerales bacterium]
MSAAPTPSQARQPALDTPAEVRAQCEAFRNAFLKLKAEVGKVIVGHGPVVEGTLMALFAGGNVLLEGVPGLGKTLLVRTLAQTLTLPFSRIQFTPDLMPADVLGTNVVMEDPATGRRKFEFQRGPIFAQVVLADEINRATPKTQSALLEAMQERSVTVGGTTYKLTAPFLVLATQNPIEQEGTYPLPEAQLDRFMFKIVVGYSQLDDLMTILDRTTGAATPEVGPMMDATAILDAQKLIRGCIVAPHVKEYVARLVLATHPQGQYASGGAGGVTNKYIRCGASPRAAQALILGGKVKALIEGRYHVSFADIKYIAPMCLRHRILVNFEAEADRIDSDTIVKQILDATQTEPLKV